jgi:hypothetical protein
MSLLILKHGNDILRINAELLGVDASIGTLGFSDLHDLHDVYFVNLTDGDVMQYDEFIARWRNVQVYEIRQYFYNKPEIDALLASVVGGTY